MRLRYTHWAGIIALLVLVCGYIIYDNHRFPIRQGLDLAGGVRVVLKLKPEPGQRITPGTLEEVVKIVRNRVDALGVAEPYIQPKGKDQVVVELAESVKEKGKPLDKRYAVEVLKKTAKLEFIYLREVKSDKNPFGRYEYKGGNTFVDRQTGRTLTDEEVRKLILYARPKPYPEGDIVLTGKNLVPGKAQANINPQTQEVETLLQLNSEGRDKFARFTREHVKDLVAIVYDGKVQSAPVIQEPIEGGDVRITHGAGATLKDAIEQANLLNAGALPVPLEVDSITLVEATLGADSVRSAKIAGLVGLGAVVLFMAVYYLLPGVLADIALFIYALLTFAVFKVIGVTLTLPGIAGFILSVGMAVDANILIFERLKEELKAGKSLHAAIDAGFARAFTSIFDSNMTTLITCAVLGYFGHGPIRGFAITLAIGVLASMFTAITVTRTFLHLVVNRPAFQKPSLFGVTRGWLMRAGRPRLDIVRTRNFWFAFSGTLILIGLVFILIGGLKPGIDFTGGALLQYRLSQRVNTRQIRSALEKVGIKDPSVTLSQEPGKKEWDAFVRAKMLNESQQARAREALKDLGGQLLSLDQVGPAISRELTRNAFLSVLLACVLITLYLSFRFAPGGFVTGLKYGVCAVIALVHDALVTLGFMALMGLLRGWEVDSLFVTAVLTVIGFSVHDTIVIFDRIRENYRNRSREDTFEDIVNRSVNQTLARSINTSLTVVLTLLALLIFGGPVLRAFVSAMLIGVISGTYSSIFNASPLVLVWNALVEKRRVIVTAPRPVTQPSSSIPRVSSTDGQKIKEPVATGAVKTIGSKPRSAKSSQKAKPKRKRRY